MHLWLVIRWNTMVPSSNREKAAVTTTYVRQGQHAPNYPQLGTHWFDSKTRRWNTEVYCYATSSCGKASTLQLSPNPGMATLVVLISSGNSRIPSKARAFGHLAGTRPFVKMSAACLSVSTYSRTEDSSSSKISWRQPRFTLCVLWMWRSFGEKPFLDNLYGCLVVLLNSELDWPAQQTLPQLERGQPLCVQRVCKTYNFSFCCRTWCWSLTFWHPCKRKPRLWTIKYKVPTAGGLGVCSLPTKVGVDIKDEFQVICGVLNSAHQAVVASSYQSTV